MGDKTLKGVPDEDDLFPTHTELSLADFCPLQVAVIVLVFIPPFEDFSLLLSLSSPLFLEEGRMQCRILQSASVADSK